MDSVIIIAAIALWTGAAVVVAVLPGRIAKAGDEESSLSALRREHVADSRPRPLSPANTEPNDVAAL